MQPEAGDAGANLVKLYEASSPRRSLTIAALVAASLLASGGPKGALAQPAAPSPAAPGGGAAGAISGMNWT